jgi:hypothetical protein
MAMRKRASSKQVANKKVPEKSAAEVFVEKYEEQRDQLGAMREDFETDFPEANLAMHAIKSQEDIVVHAISVAKAGVGMERKTIGDFICSRAFSSAGYDEKKFTEILLEMKDPGPLLARLMSAGVIKTFKVDKGASAAFSAANPKVAKPLNNAWKDKEELTPRVTVPKL